MSKQKPTYLEMLRDPRWQRKRLEVMQREDFACQDCGATDSTLNVHHTYYEKGKPPWDYPIESLKCLCEPCHVKAQDYWRLIQIEIAELDSHAIQIAIGVMRGYRAFAADCDRILVDST